jgi:hypothetical protein
LGFFAEPAAWMPEARPVTGSHKDVRACGVYNAIMILHGHFENGVVVLDGGTPLPDGTAVTIAEQTQAPKPTLLSAGCSPFPLIQSQHPGTLDFSTEQINEFACGS